MSHVQMIEINYGKVMERRPLWSQRCACKEKEKGGNNLKQRERWVKADLRELEGEMLGVYWKTMEEGWL